MLIATLILGASSASRAAQLHRLRATAHARIDSKEKPIRFEEHGFVKTLVASLEDITKEPPSLIWVDIGDVHCIGAVLAEAWASLLSANSTVGTFPLLVTSGSEEVDVVAVLQYVHATHLANRTESKLVLDVESKHEDVDESPILRPVKSLLDNSPSQPFPLTLLISKLASFIEFNALLPGHPALVVHYSAPQAKEEQEIDMYVSRDHQDELRIHWHVSATESKHDLLRAMDEPEHSVDDLGRKIGEIECHVQELERMVATGHAGLAHTRSMSEQSEESMTDMKNQISEQQKNLKLMRDQHKLIAEQIEQINKELSEHVEQKHSTVNEDAARVRQVMSRLESQQEGMKLNSIKLVTPSTDTFTPKLALTGLNALDDYVCLHIARYLTPVDLVHIGLTCRSWYRVTEHPSLWRGLFTSRCHDVYFTNALTSVLAKEAWRLVDTHVVRALRPPDMGAEPEVKSAKIYRHSLHGHALLGGTETDVRRADYVAVMRTLFATVTRAAHTEALTVDDSRRDKLVLITIASLVIFGSLFALRASLGDIIPWTAVFSPLFLISLSACIYVFFSLRQTVALIFPLNVRIAMLSTPIVLVLLALSADKYVEIPATVITAPLAALVLMFVIPFGWRHCHAANASSREMTSTTEEAPHHHRRRASTLAQLATMGRKRRSFSSWFTAGIVISGMAISCQFLLLGFVLDNVIIIHSFHMTLLPLQTVLTFVLCIMLYRCYDIMKQIYRERVLRLTLVNQSTRAARLTKLGNMIFMTFFTSLFIFFVFLVCEGLMQPEMYYQYKIMNEDGEVMGEYEISLWPIVMLPMWLALICLCCEEHVRSVLAVANKSVSSRLVLKNVLLFGRRTHLLHIFCLFIACPVAFVFALKVKNTFEEFTWFWLLILHMPVIAILTIDGVLRGQTVLGKLAALSFAGFFAMLIVGEDILQGMHTHPSPLTVTSPLILLVLCIFFDCIVFENPNIHLFQWSFLVLVCFLVPLFGIPMTLMFPQQVPSLSVIVLFAALGGIIVLISAFYHCLRPRNTTFAPLGEQLTTFLDANTANPQINQVWIIRFKLEIGFLLADIIICLLSWMWGYERDKVNWDNIFSPLWVYFIQVYYAASRRPGVPQ